MAKKVTPKSLAEVMARLTTFILNEDKKSQQLWCDELNNLLDEALSQDAFGTEGQLDPRGDGR